MKDLFNTVDITTPKNGMVVMRDRYWLCENGDETKALFYGNSPQCNQNEKIMEWSMKKEMYSNRNVKIVFMDIAFVPQVK